MGKKSRVDPNIEPDVGSRGDPFSYGRHKYTPAERSQIIKSRAKDYRKFGVGHVVGAGGSAGASTMPAKYRIVNEPEKASDAYKAVMAVRNGKTPRSLFSKTKNQGNRKKKN